MKVSDEVVEVAADALCLSHSGFTLKGSLPCVADGYRRQARAALEAALPLVLGEPVAWCRRQKNGLSIGGLEWTKRDVLNSPVFDPEIDEPVALYAPKEQQP